MGYLAATHPAGAMAESSSLRARHPPSSMLSKHLSSKNPQVPKPHGPKLALNPRTGPKPQNPKLALNPRYIGPKLNPLKRPPALNPKHETRNRHPTKGRQPGSFDFRRADAFPPEDSKQLASESQSFRNFLAFFWLAVRTLTFEVSI